jgi:oligoendopeptidase F
MEKNLPLWDLTDFYAGMEDPQFQKDFDILNDLTQFFIKNYEGQINDTISPKKLGESIIDFEKIKELGQKIMSFAGLQSYADTQDPTIQRFFQSTIERITSITTPLIFYTLDLNKLSDGVMENAIECDPILQKYKPWIHQVRSYLPHQLDEKLEKLMTDKSLTGHNILVRLFDESLSALTFDFNGEKLGISAVSDLMSSPDPKVREQAALSMVDGLSHSLKLFALITNTLAKDKELDDTWRSFKTPSSSRHLANQIEDEVVVELVNAVKSRYAELSHRYYKLKASMLKVDKINYWDRNAPVVDIGDERIPYATAKDIVLKAYGDFCKDIAAIGERFFDNNWIDVPMRATKYSGAFAHPTVPSLHPYILLNYQGKHRDVTTLAHELGHGVHQILAAHQGLFLSQTPLTLAETASVFGEMLTFQSLLKNASTKNEKIFLLESKISDMMNTVVRQIAFYDFETKVHNTRREGQELSIEQLNGFWLSTQRDALGDAVNIDDKLGCFWAYVPHFIHSPFYVYAYAFGDCLVNSLYQYYQNNPDGFVEKYTNLLKAGGSQHHSELLKPFGIDIKDKSFWDQGLNLIISYVDELESLIAGE